jgi:hypothetical protein
MKIEVIEGLILSGMSLVSWDDTQSSGVWVALTEEDFDFMPLQRKVNESLRSNVELKTYFQAGGLWLPIAISDSLDGALVALEVKLSEMPIAIKEKGSKYRTKAQIAYDAIVNSETYLEQ